jgi:hypothetical protein
MVEKIPEEEMQKAELEVAKRQQWEQLQQQAQPVRTDSERDLKLVEISARMASKREIIDAEDVNGNIHKVGIDIPEEYPEPFTEDITKSNLTPQEIACGFGHLSIINIYKGLGQARKFSFREVCEFNVGQFNGIINLSRGRAGFASILMKTDKHISEGMVQHIQKGLEEKKKGMFSFFGR